MINKKLSASLEDYLEAIYQIVREKQAAKVRDIAQRLSVSSSSVTGALHALSARELVNYTPYDIVTLTEKGARQARKIVQRHSALRDFLTNVLDTPYNKADETACRMEHVIESDVLQRLLRFSEFVMRCPRAGEQWLKEANRHCGPGEDSCLGDAECADCFALAKTLAKKETGALAPLRARGAAPSTKAREAKKVAKTRPLAAIKTGSAVKIAQIIGGNRGFQERLSAMGLLPGTVLTVKKNSGRGSMLVNIKGSRLALGRGMAQKIQVTAAHDTSRSSKFLLH